MSAIRSRPGLSRWLAGLLCCGLLLPGLPAAATFPEKPPNANWYVDEAGLLTADAARQVDQLASKLFTEQRVPLYVVTVRSLASHDAGLSIEGYARELFDHWGIGTQERNYGILLLISRGDRKARIELGADWGDAYDADARSVMNRLIVPAFKRDDYAAGIVDGVRGLDAMARGLALPKPTTPWWFWPLVIGALVGLGLLIFNLFKSGRRGWAWALIAALGVLLFFLLRNSGGGSSGGFGGGSSGGGGATGSW